MDDKLVIVIDDVVDAIYKLEIKKIDAKFVELLDGLDSFIRENPDEKWDNVVIALQNAYIKKDYVEFADVLLYDIKPLIQEKK